MSLPNVGKKSGYKVVSKKPKITPKKGVKVSSLAVSYSAASGMAVATWAWSKSHLDHFNARWDYKVATTGGNKWIIGESRSTGKTKQSTFNVPDGALAVRCNVKPVSTERTIKYQIKKKEKYTSGDKKGQYYWDWTQGEVKGLWFKGESISKEANASGSVTPDAPGTPILSAGTGTGVNVGVSSDSGSTLKVELKLYTNGAWNSHSGGKAIKTINSGEVTVANAFYAANGNAYRVDARQQNTTTGAWSDYSAFSDIWEAPPLAPTGLSISAISATAFSARWTKEGYTGNNYELRWGQDRDSLLIDELPEGAYSVTIRDATTYSASIASGTWYFAVRGTTTNTNGAWSAIVSYTSGLTPAKPTIATLPAYVALGSEFDMQWTYNNADGSVQSAYEVQASIDGGAWATVASGNTSASSIAYTAASGATVAFRVRTKGAVAAWSEWGTSETVGIDPPLTVTLTIGDTSTLPLSIEFSADAEVRLWHLLVTCAETHSTVGEDGNDETVPAGSLAFEAILQVGDDGFDPRSVQTSLDLSNAELVTGCTYNAVLSAISSHGLTDDDSKQFTASWDGNAPEPSATIPPVGDDLEAHIFPACYTDVETGEIDEDGNPIYELAAGVTLDVYRLDADGTPLLVAENLPNDGAVEVVDPHPNFGECWYRIAATAQDGSRGFVDEGVYVDCEFVVLQFDDGLRSYTDEFDALGYIELPYNIEIGEGYKPDAELAEFIGNDDPTLYVGTQLGRTVSTSGVVLTSDDDDVIRRFRWLAGSRVQAYYRDPSGLGFWAWVVPSLKWNRREPIEVSLSISRVTGDYMGRVV